MFPRSRQNQDSIPDFPISRPNRDSGRNPRRVGHDPGQIGIPQIPACQPTRPPESTAGYGTCGVLASVLAAAGAASGLSSGLPERVVRSVPVQCTKYRLKPMQKPPSMWLTPDAGFSVKALTLHGASTQKLFMNVCRFDRARIARTTP
jgi:hypothetical protein